MKAAAAALYLSVPEKILLSRIKKAGLGERRDMVPGKSIQAALFQGVFIAEAGKIHYFLDVFAEKAGIPEPGRAT